MRVSLNHVALSATDLERSTRFYEQLFDCARLPVPDVGFPTVWLSLGDRQLHLFERDTPVPPLHHFAVAVDDFAEACGRAEALGAFEGAPYGREAYRLPERNGVMRNPLDVAARRGVATLHGAGQCENDRLGILQQVGGLIGAQQGPHSRQ